MDCDCVQGRPYAWFDFRLALITTGESEGREEREPERHASPAHGRAERRHGAAQLSE
jgi:hypothetical protein